MEAHGLYVRTLSARLGEVSGLRVVGAAVVAPRLVRANSAFEKQGRARVAFARRVPAEKMA